MPVEKEWGRCPHCDATIKYRNMSSHMKRVHQVYDKSSMKQRVASRKRKGRGTKKKGHSKKKEDAEELRIHIARQKQQVRTIIAVGIIVVVLLVSSVVYWLFIIDGSSDGDEDKLDDTGNDALGEDDVDPKIGTYAVSFNGTDTLGEPFELEDHLGRSPILLEFFSATCGKCEYLSSVLKEISEVHGDEIVMISVSTSARDSLESIIEFKSSYGSDWTYVVPPLRTKDGIRENYTISGYPTITIIDNSGVIVDTIFSKYILQEYASDYKLISDAVEAVLEEVEGTDDENVGSEVGDRAPRFNVTDTNGNHFDLYDKIGEKPILLEFMYTQCGLCNDLADVLKDINGLYGDRIIMASIATSSKDDINTMRQFQQTHGSVWSHLCGDKNENFLIQRDYSHGAFPSMVMIDSDGLIFQWIRADDLEDYDMEYNHDLIADALNEVLKA